MYSSYGASRLPFTTLDGLVIWSFSERWLPEPQIIILPHFDKILKAIQDTRYVGELRQRWLEIKKLRAPHLNMAVDIKNIM